MEELFENSDVIKLQGKPHLYDYYLFFILDKKKMEFQMSYSSNQLVHFDYSGTFTITDNWITLQFTKSYPIFVFCEEDLLATKDMNFRHKFSFVVIKEDLLHDYSHDKIKSTKTVKFSISPFIHDLSKDGIEAYEVDRTLPNRLYVVEE